MVTVSTVSMLVKRNLRRGRLQLGVVAILAFVAAGLLNLGALCAVRYPQLFDAEGARLNAPDVQILAPVAKAVTAERSLRSDARVTQLERSEVLTDQATIDYGKATMDTTLVYIDLDHQPTLGRSEVLHRNDAGVSDPVYLPALFDSPEKYRIGDPFVVTTLAGKRTFHVAGFMENLYLGQITMGATGIGLPDAGYRALATATPTPNRASLVQARVTPASAAPDVTARASGALIGSDQVQANAWSWNWGLLRQADLAGPSIYAASLVLFTIVVAIVVLLVIWFWIRGAIDQDLPAIGVLATVGTSPGRVRRSLVLAPVLVVALGAVAGVLASYLVVPLVADSLASQTGLPWHPGIDPVSGLAAVAVLTLVSAGLALAASRPVRKVRPVEALHGGTATRSFRRNPMPLSRSHGGLNLLLGLKQSVANRGQSLMVVGVLAVVAFGGMFSTALYTNVLNNPRGFTRMLIGEVGDVYASVRPEADHAAVQRAALAVPGVERAMYKEYLQGFAGDLQSMVVVMDDYGQQHYSSIVSGREPKHANEIAIGVELAKQSGVGIGGSITVRVAGVSRSYLVVGTLSTVQYAGLRVDLTRAGYALLVPQHRPTDLDIYLAPGADPQTVITTLRSSVGGELSLLLNKRQSIDSQFDVYIQMVRLLADGILIVTATVTALVIGLMVATLLKRERQSFGVRKAIGFTGWQLTRQLIASYLPAVVVGALIGVGAGLLLVPRMVTAMLSSIGVSRLSMTASPALVAALCGGLVLLAIGMTVLGALPLLRRGSLQLMTAE